MHALFLADAAIVDAATQSHRASVTSVQHSWGERGTKEQVAGESPCVAVVNAHGSGTHKPPASPRPPFPPPTCSTPHKVSRNWIACNHVWSSGSVTSGQGGGMGRDEGPCLTGNWPLRKPPCQPGNNTHPTLGVPARSQQGLLVAVRTHPFPQSLKRLVPFPHLVGRQVVQGGGQHATAIAATIITHFLSLGFRPPSPKGSCFARHEQRCITSRGGGGGECVTTYKTSGTVHGVCHVSGGCARNVDEVGAKM